MDERKSMLIVILIIVLVIMVVVIGYVYINNSNVQFKTIYLSNATTIEVPVSDESKFFSDDVGIKYYQDPKHGVSIISFNSQEEPSLAGASSAAAQFAAQKGSSTPTVEDGVPVYYNSQTGMYCIQIGNNTTHDNIMIVCKDKDMALKIYHSIKFAISSINKDTGSSAPTPSNTSQTDNHSDDYYYDDYDYDDYDDYDYVSSSDSGGSGSGGSGSGHSSSPNVETTTG